MCQSRAFCRGRDKDRISSSSLGFLIREQGTEDMIRES
jgi:hypothetical protein